MSPTPRWFQSDIGQRITIPTITLTARQSTTPDITAIAQFRRPVSWLSSGAADSCLAQPVSRLQGLRRVRVSLNQVSQLAHAIILLAELQ